MTFDEYRIAIEKDIQDAYESPPTVEEAERLAAKFLTAMIKIGRQYRNASLDARMRKTGLKAVKSAVYMEAATKGDKKPTEAMLQATVDRDEIVSGEQGAFDTAEVDAAEIGNLLAVVKEGHLYFRGLSKGKYE